MQAYPLLQTKLYVPPVRPELVSRPRLIERLNAGLRRKLTIVSAPAGFGKTTLLSEWVCECGRQVAWLSLDEGDNDFAHFVTHLIAALQMVKPGLGEMALAVFQSPQLPPVVAVLTSLINEIAKVSERLVLVLDDYHVIHSSTNQAVGLLLERLPPQLHLVILTRRDPHLPLARLRARGQMTEIRHGDLQFTGDEAALFLNQAMGLGLTAEEIALLEGRTEGWIAGLQLAALALQGRSPLQNRAEFIRAFSGDDRYVIDFLVSEVLSGQPEEVQRFLLRTAILDRLCGPLCDAVCFGEAKTPSSSGRTAGMQSDSAEPTGGAQDKGQRLLEYLDRANLFLMSLDNRREWYRYHQLFGDVLMRRLRHAEPDQIPELHRRASTWYRGEGHLDEAIHHSLAAQDREVAARLVEQNALQLLIHSELTTLIRWLDALPDDLIRSRPWLSVYSAWAQLTIGQIQVTQLRLNDAQRLSHLAGADLAGHIAVIRARIALARQDLSSAVKFARQALETVPARHPVHGHIAVIEGQVAFLQGDLVGASGALREAASIAQDCGHLFMVVDATTRLGYVQTLQGHLRRGLETYQEALHLANVGGQTLPVAGNAHIRMALALRQQNELDAAAHHLTQGLELCKLFGNPRSGYLGLALLRQAQGDWDGAFRAVQDAERQGAGLGADLVVEVEHLRLWLALVQGSPLAGSTKALAEALRWMHESGLSVDDELTFDREPEHILLARGLVALNRLAEATVFLERLFLAAKAGGRAEREIEILVLRAMAFQTLGDSSQALDCLGRALALAEPEGYVRFFLDEGQAMVKLLHQAVSRDIAPEYARALLAATVTAAREVPTQSLVDPLSERERQVLRLLRTDLSGPEIAEELMISVNTVRFHTKNIYGKLGVNNRRQAVDRAGRLGLL